MAGDLEVRAVVRRDQEELDAGGDSEEPGKVAHVEGGREGGGERERDEEKDLKLDWCEQRCGRRKEMAAGRMGNGNGVNPLTRFQYFGSE